jgi:hypothetical protein
LDKVVQNFISYDAAILLSKDGKKLIITLEKPIERFFDEEESDEEEEDGEIANDIMDLQ